jgi:hypothetical protein
VRRPAQDHCVECACLLRSVGSQPFPKSSPRRTRRAQSRPSTSGRELVASETVAAARKFPLWPALAAVVAFVLPYGWIWGTATFVVFGLVIHKAIQRGAVVNAQMEEETRQLWAAHAHEAEHLRGTLASADNGFPGSLRLLLKRWHACRPDALRQFVIELGGDGGHYWMLGGHGGNRDEIPTGTPRVGRGGRTVFDKRSTALEQTCSRLSHTGRLTRADVCGLSTHPSLVRYTGPLRAAL